MNGDSSYEARRDHLLGGIWGLLFGSAFGEVRLAWFKEHPKSGSIRNRITGASWSIEAAQILCLLAALRRGELPLDGLAERTFGWARLGVYFPDSEYRFANLDGPLTTPTLFGVDYTTLENYQQHAVEQSALLFVIPLLLSGESDIAKLAHQILTLGKGAVHDDIDRVTLIMGLLWADALTDASSDAWQKATDGIRALAEELDFADSSIETVTNVMPGDSSHSKTHQMLYLLAYVREVFRFTETFDSAVDFAMPPRPELRIPMMLTGALAGLHYGMLNIPFDWFADLRGRELAQACLVQLRVDHSGQE